MEYHWQRRIQAHKTTSAISIWCTERPFRSISTENKEFCKKSIKWEKCPFEMTSNSNSLTLPFSIPHISIQREQHSFLSEVEGSWYLLIHGWQVPLFRHLTRTKDRWLNVAILPIRSLLRSSMKLKCCLCRELAIRNRKTAFLYFVSEQTRKLATWIVNSTNTNIYMDMSTSSKQWPIFVIGCRCLPDSSSKRGYKQVSTVILSKFPLYRFFRTYELVWYLSL